MTIGLVSSDHNGTLVHQQTMSDIVRLYRGKVEYEILTSQFTQKAEGNSSAAETLSVIAPSTRGLTLRQAIEYTRMHMAFVDGFHDFVDALNNNGINLVINTTGYSVTIYAIREQIGRDKIPGHIDNFLRFGEDGNPNATLREDELEALVSRYFRLQDYSDESPVYDKIRATGRVEISIGDEEVKTRLLLEYIHQNFPDLRLDRIAHIGDTMGFSRSKNQVFQSYECFAPYIK